MSYKFNDYVELKGISKILNYLASYLLENTTICQCLKYDSPDCLSKTITNEDKDNLINSKLENKPNRRIYFQSSLNKTSTNERTELRIYPAWFNIENRVLGKTCIAIDIVFHNDLNDLDNSEIRPMILLNEILKSINGVDVKGIGLLNIEGQKIPLITVNDYFSMYRMNFIVRVT